MPRYTFLLYHPDEAAWHDVVEQDWTGVLARRRAFESEARARGARVIGGEELVPPAHATTVRREEPAEPPVLRDGGVGEPEEVLTGFYVIEAQSHDQALALASICPAEIIEVRPVRQQ